MPYFPGVKLCAPKPSSTCFSLGSSVTKANCVPQFLQVWTPPALSFPDARSVLTRSPHHSGPPRPWGHVTFRTIPKAWLLIPPTPGLCNPARGVCSLRLCPSWPGACLAHGVEGHFLLYGETAQGWAAGTAKARRKMAALLLPGDLTSNRSAHLNFLI